MERQGTQQRDLRTLELQVEEWETKWRMEFHPSKCNVMRMMGRWTFHHHYTHSKPLTQREILLKGVDVQTNLSWKDHVSWVTKKANSMLGFIRRNLGTAKEESLTENFVQSIKMVQHTFYLCCYLSILSIFINFYFTTGLTAE